MSHPAVSIRALRFSYPDGHQALRGVDLRVEHGQRVALLGANGAGKTTLALQLCGIGEPDSGTVEIGGLAVVAGNLPEIRRRVGLVFQDADDQLFMPTVGDDVAFGPANLGLRGADLAERVTAALGEVAAGDVVDRAPHHLERW